MQTEYRRKKDTETWHWCTQCSNWPTTDYDALVSNGRPQTGKLDKECQSMEQAGTCTMLTH